MRPAYLLRRNSAKSGTCNRENGKGAEYVAQPGKNIRFVRPFNVLSLF